ncbi:MAG: hypothetical protein IPH10_04550 [bacterium]|nr:hypothetical protein [bacterium]
MESIITVFFLSQDGGESWTSFNEGFPFERIHINNIVSRNDTLYTYTRNSGIFRLDNGTDTWMPYEITSRQFGARGELSFVYPRMFLSEQANRMEIARRMGRMSGRFTGKCLHTHQSSAALGRKSTDFLLQQQIQPIYA